MVSVLWVLVGFCAGVLLTIIAVEDAARRRMVAERRRIEEKMRARLNGMPRSNDPIYTLWGKIE